MSIQQGAVCSDEADGDPVLANEAETAEYIGDLLDELERLARGQGLVKLQYLLMETRDEARRAAAG
jgi:hypothetical protein